MISWVSFLFLIKIWWYYSNINWLPLFILSGMQLKNIMILELWAIISKIVKIIYCDIGMISYYNYDAGIAIIICYDIGITSY